jgi:hypothetical protein
VKPVYEKNRYMRCFGLFFKRMLNAVVSPRENNIKNN